MSRWLILSLTTVARELGALSGPSIEPATPFRPEALHLACARVGWSRCERSDAWVTAGWLALSRVDG